MVSKLLRFGRRQLHTIVSRDIIKPSSPTPSHLKTYNLSLFDQLAVNAYAPFVAFYPSTRIYQSSHDKTVELKNSLSHTLSRYYPYAGRLAKAGPTYVDCNDDGVEFIEASNDGPLSDFLHRSAHEDLDQLFPDDLIWYKSNHKAHTDENERTSPLSVQVNHFSCGGVAVAVSLSHKIADASSILNFLKDWATVTRSRGEHRDLSHINPHFLSYKTRNIKLPKNMPDRPQGDYVTRSFVFPNSKINDLKAKITNMTMESGEPIMNPTRAEALTWLIHKCAVAAACKTKSGIFKPTGVGQVMSIRNNLVEQLPETSIGNLYLLMEFPTRDESDLTPHNIIGELRKRKKEFRSIKNTETALGIVSEMCSDHTAMLETTKRLDDYYIYTVINRFPTYGIDFGWGKPIKVTVGGVVKNLIIMMNTPNGDGIETLLSLDGQDMKIIQNDPELLAFC
ncbi:acylsugar acyltransferase 3 [Lactuca sativa]|uniref:acylsugar acyltransferase 3 n=1 Tax=Lactuca sativa TaxID=4236 RepID=UPI000CA6802C|nr:acylsugar acyltransferase 3 [Lactuca sativa]